MSNRPETVEQEVTDISIKKKLKLKKPKSVTEEIIPEELNEFYIKVEDIIEISETRPESIEIKPEDRPEIVNQEVTDSLTEKRKIKTKKRDSVTEEVTPEVIKESEVKVKEL